MPRGAHLRRPSLTQADRLLRGSRRRAIASALAAIGAVALTIGVLIGGGVPASSKGASTPRISGSGVTTVQRRDLIATDTQAGTLGYADPRIVFNRVSGTLTWLPSVGSRVKPGGTLYQVDGSPIVLFDGPVPAYRTLTAGIADGPDVAELKQNLVSLGFDPGHTITVNNTFDAATTTAIDAWQASLGETQTGQITLGKVVFLPGARRISAVSGVLGSTGGGSGAGSSSSSSAGGTTTGASATTSSTSGATAASFQPNKHPSTEFVSFTTTSSGAGAPAAGAGAPAGAGPPAGAGAQAGAGAPAAADMSLRASAGTAVCKPVEPSDASGASSPTPTTTTPTTPCLTKAPPGSKSSGKPAPTATQLLAQLVAALKKLASSSSRTAAAGASSTSRGATTATTTSRGASTGSASGTGSSSAGAGGSASSAGATGAATATQILQTTSADLVVTVPLDATKQSEAVIGSPVTVQLPDGNTDNGRISGVSSVAQSTSSSSTGAGGAASGTPTATVPVTITLTGHRRVAGLDQAAVSVNFEQQVERGVLSVPVTALLATPGGGYAVQTVQGGQSRLVAVTPGLFAGGFVQVSGPDLVEGMQVSNSQG